MMSHIQVCIKVRPCDPGYPTLWQVKEGRSIQLADSHAEPSFFDHVFDQDVENQEVFDLMARHIVHACIQGFNGTIFAYGQTWSGKTYTMMGDSESPGVIVLATKEIFQQIANETRRDFLLRVGYIEIYNEKIYDLLNKKNQDLKIHEAGNGIVNVNCEECIITTEADLLRLLCLGNKERTAGEAYISERSGHSHAILRIIIESKPSGSSGTVTKSILNLVDLAGSERLGDSPTGARGTVGVHINKSLMFLSNVVKHLSENADNKFISFRDCKLTRFLQASLCGNALTSIICTIRPSVVEESLSTLKFATLAKKIRINPHVNEMRQGSAMFDLLERVITDLKIRYNEERSKKGSQLRAQSLERKIKSETLKIIAGQPPNEPQNLKRSRTVPELGTPKSALTGNPKNTRLSRVPKLQKPANYSDNLAASQREVAAKTKPTEVSMGKESKLPIGNFQFANKNTRSSYDVRQTEVPALTASNQSANVKIQAYEEQLRTLNEVIRRLEMDNRRVKTLEEEIDSNKAQAKLLENHLLSTIHEKDVSIENLQQSLKDLSRDVLNNSKQDHMRSVCPELESSCERICNKCQEFGRLLPLTDAKGLEKVASDQLREEIAATRAKLERVQSAFSQASCEVIQKTDDCKRLNRQISTVHNDFGQLQERYDTLAQQSLLQKLAIEKILADFQTIQQKYQELQAKYESLGHTSNASEEQCQQLQADNTRLQLEIGTLKERMEEAQRKLMAANPSLKAQAKDLKADKEHLEAKLAEMEANFKKFQREYDDLNLCLQKSVAENEVLRNELKSSLKEKPVSHTDDISQQFAKLSETIELIELKNSLGICRLCRVPETEAGDDQNVTGFRLCAFDGTDYEGVLKHQMIQEQLNDGDTISRLKEEVQEKNSLIKETSIAFQHKIVDLEKQNIELMEKVCERQTEIDRLELTFPEYEKQIEELGESLRKAKDEITQREKQKTDEINALQLEYMAKMERIENENRTKFREYTKELQESKDRYESDMATMKEQLSSANDRCQANLLQLSQEDEKMIALKAQQQAELEQIKNTLTEKLLEADEKQKQLVTACDDVRTSLQDQIRQAEDEQKKALDELAKLRSTLGESQKQIKELQGKCDQQARELDTQSQQRELETREFEKKVRAFTVKNKDLEEELDRAQLQAASQHQNEMKQIKEHQEKYEQLATYADNLREEKSGLQSKIKEAEARHSSTLRKLHDLEMQTDDLSKQRVTEKSELEGKLETVTAKISDLEAEVQAAMLKAERYDDLISKHEKLKSNLSKAKAVSSNLQEKVDSLQSQLLAYEKDISGKSLEIREIRLELRHALAAKDTLNAEKVTLATQLQAVEDKMSSEAGKWKKEVSDLNGSMNELQLKLQSLQEQNGQLEADNIEMKSMLRNAANLQSQLEEELRLCASLRVEFAKLAETNARLEDKLRTKEAKINRKSKEMVKDLKQSRQSIGELTKECDKLRCDLEAKTECFQREKQGLDSTIYTLLKDKQLLEQKINCLNDVNDSLNAEHQAQLRAKEAETEALREAFTYQKSAAEVVPQMQRKVDELSKEIESLQTNLKSKETSFLAKSQSMDATITSLLEDKRNLEEKQCTLNEIIDKLEAKLSGLQDLKIIGSNSSFESNTSSGSASSEKRLTKNVNRKAGASDIKKSVIADCAGRKERRKTALDERRKQSYLKDFQDSKEAESLKNAQLKSRLLEEQHKQKRLQHKIRDLNAIGHPTDPPTISGCSLILRRGEVWEQLSE